MRSLLGRAPLRVQLVAVVVLLSGLGLVVSGAVASNRLHGYLQDRVDQQLQGFLNRPIPIGNPSADGRFGGGDDQFTTVFRQYVDTTGAVAQVVPPGYQAPKVKTTEAGSPHTVGSVSGEGQWRVLGAVDRSGNPVVLGLSLRDVESTTHQLLLLELAVGAAVLVVLGAGGYLVVRRSLKPLVEVETTAEAIAAGDLSLRVPESDPRTEVGSLSQSFNAMLAQIEQAFSAQALSEADARASEERMRRFVGDASHELRTPLTSIRGFAELYRQGALTTPDDVARAMSRVEGEASRMGMLVEDLLLLARLDQQRPLEQAPVDLLELAGDAVQDARAVDPARSVTLEAVAAGPAPVVLGDAARLRQVFGNLISNALTYTRSPLVLRVATTDTEAVVDVVDSGPGIAPEDRDRVFERFFRTDTSRTRASGGSGLGLSIVSALVGAHGGTASVSETPGGGATFTVRLPLAVAASVPEEPAVPV